MTWVSELANLIHRRWTPGDLFTLQQVYEFESELSRLHPENSHVRARIRQALQIMRDSGYIWFVDDDGHYQLVR